MSGKHISQEKQQLLRKAEQYYLEWEEARMGLEKSSKDFGRKFILVLVIGLSLLYIFRLLGSGAGEETAGRESNSKLQNRFFRAAKNIALPLLLKSMKNIVLNDNNSGYRGSEEHAD